MKKLMTALLGLSLMTGLATLSVARDDAKTDDTSKKAKKAKKTKKSTKKDDTSKMDDKKEARGFRYLLDRRVAGTSAGYAAVRLSVPPTFDPPELTVEATSNNL
jgi:hypothetical protein